MCNVACCMQCFILHARGNGSYCTLAQSSCISVQLMCPSSWKVFIFTNGGYSIQRLNKKLGEFVLARDLKMMRQRQWHNRKSGNPFEDQSNRTPFHSVWFFNIHTPLHNLMYSMANPLTPCSANFPGHEFPFIKPAASPTYIQVSLLSRSHGWISASLHKCSMF